MHASFPRLWGGLKFVSIPDERIRREANKKPRGLMEKGITNRDFRLVNWHNGREGTNAQTSNDTTDHHHGNTCGKCLKSTANEEYDGAIEYSPSAADHITNTSHKERGYECSNFENCNHSTNCSPRRLVEVIFEVPATASVSHIPISMASLCSRDKTRTL